MKRLLIVLLFLSLLLGACVSTSDYLSSESPPTPAHESAKSHITSYSCHTLPLTGRICRVVFEDAVCYVFVTSHKGGIDCK